MQKPLHETQNSTQIEWFEGWFEWTQKVEYTQLSEDLSGVHTIGPKSFLYIW